MILLLLGLVQGLCEFLPISSSGHLVLLSRIFGIEDSLFVSIILHIATLFAVVIVMRKEIFYLIRHPFSKEAMSIYISTIFTVIIALVLMPLITTSFEGNVLPITFLLSGILLIISQKCSKKMTNDVDCGKITFKRAIIMGLAQGLAIFPGLSRSGTTISAGLLSGGDKEECAKFSFLISIPIILASMLLEIVKISISGQTISVDVVPLVGSFIIALVIGILTIKLMLKLTQKLNFKFFSIYLFVMAIISAIVIW